VNAGMYVSGSNWLIENNNISNLHSGPVDADYSRFFGQGHIFKGNRFYGTAESNVQNSHVDCFQTWHLPSDRYEAKNMTFDGNICRDAHQGILANVMTEPYDSSSGMVIKNNIFANLWSYAIGTSNMSNVQVYDNTFSNIKYYVMYLSGAETTGLDFHNNIVDGVGQTVFETNNVRLDAVRERDNLFSDYRNLSKFNGQYNNLIISSGTVLDKDPMFTNPRSGDFSLKLGSPAMNMGATHFSP
jgi:hypothetical protein